MVLIQNIDDLQQVLQQTQFLNEINLLIKINKAHKSIINDLSKLFSLFPKLQYLQIYIKGSYLNNNFLKQINNSLNELKCLHKISFQFKQTDFTFKAAKSFMTFIKSRFYSDTNFIESFSDDQVQLEVGGCLICFNYDKENSLLLKELQSKCINIKIKQGQSNFLKQVQKQVDKQHQNLHVNIYHQEKLLVQCLNCSSNYDLKVNLIIEDEIDLMSLSVINHSLVIIDIESDEYNCFDKEKNQIMQDLQERYNFQSFSQENKRKILVSLQNEDLLKTKVVFLKKQMQQYDLTFQSVYINNYFQFKFYRDILQDNCLSSVQYTPANINLYVRNKDKHKIYARLTNSKLKKKEIQKEINVILDHKLTLLQFLKIYFDYYRNKSIQFLKLTLFLYKEDCQTDSEDKIFKEKSYMEIMADFNKNILVNKLRIKSALNNYMIESQYQPLYMKLPIIGQIINLETISLKLYNSQQFISFLALNEKELSNQHLSKSIMIIANMSALNYTENKISKTLQDTKYNFARIISIRLKNYFEWTELEKVTNRFLRFVSFDKSQTNRYYSSYMDEYNCSCFYCFLRIYSKLQDEFKENPEKMIDFAYERVEAHNPSCSETRKLQCTCTNNQFSKIYKTLQSGQFKQSIWMLYNQE